MLRGIDRLQQTLFGICEFLLRKAHTCGTIRSSSLVDNFHKCVRADFPSVRLTITARRVRTRSIYGHL